MICVRPERGLERIKTNHRGSYDRLENEKLVFHQKVYQAYLEVQKKFPNRIIIIDGEKTKEEVKKASLEEMCIRDRGGSKIAEKIREVILDVDNTGMDDRTEALLYLSLIHIS